MVFDFDFSANNMTPGSAFRIQAQFYDHNTSTGAESSKQEGHLELRASESDNTFYLASSANGSIKMHTLDTGSDEWHHITIIYDTRDTVNSTPYAYAYVNGQFVGSFPCADKGAAYLRAFRLVYDVIGKQSGDNPNQGVDLANISLKSYSNTYTGSLRTFAETNMGNRDYSLDDVPALQFYNEKELPVTKIGDIIRDGVTTPVYENEAFDDALMDGDKVVLYRYLEGPVVIPNGANITWEDKNGTPAAESDLISMPAIIELDETVVFVTRYANGTYKKGGADELAASFAGTQACYVKLYRDANVELISDYVDLSDRIKFVLNLNGHKLTINKMTNHFINAGGASYLSTGSVVIIKDGDIEIVDSTSRNFIFSAGYCYVTFE